LPSAPPTGSERATLGCVDLPVATKRRLLREQKEPRKQGKGRGSPGARRGDATMNKWIILAACLAAAGCTDKTVAGQVAGGDPGIAKSASDPVTAAAAGSPFGAHEPRTSCPPRKFAGPPTARQAMDLLICDSEKYVDGYLYLVSDVTVQTGKSRPYSGWSDSGHTDIDTTAAVWPIQGQMTNYQCSRRDAMLTADPNRNCIRTDHAQATGACYVSTFGEWHCAMGGAGAFMPGLQPPPVGG
jgi:hypothetical protein